MLEDETLFTADNSLTSVGEDSGEVAMGGIETLHPCEQMFSSRTEALPMFSSSEVDLTEVAQVALPALQKISSHEWQEALRNVDEISVKRLSGAITNKVFECKWREPSGESRRVLVRLYGNEVDSMFSREQEIETFERLSQQGYGPQLLARFPQGRVEEWLHARTLSLTDLRDPACSVRIAAKLAEFHRLDMGPPRSPTVWSRLRAWLVTALEVASPLLAAEFQLTELEEEIAELEEKLGAEGVEEGCITLVGGHGVQRGEWAKDKCGSKGHVSDGAKEELRESMQTRGPKAQRRKWGIGFCHNDLQYGNLMADVRTGAITIIDYEYAGYNPIAFDIGNHFCEFAADYHSDSPHLLNYAVYPSLEERLRFCHAYLLAAGVSPSSENVASLVEEADKYTLVSHLHWGLWGIIFGAGSNMDFNYIEYARQRLAAYFKSKDGLLDRDPHLPATFATCS